MSDARAGDDRGADEGAPPDATPPRRRPAGGNPYRSGPMDQAVVAAYRSAGPRWTPAVGPLVRRRSWLLLWAAEMAAVTLGLTLAGGFFGEADWPRVGIGFGVAALVGVAVGWPPRRLAGAPVDVPVVPVPRSRVALWTLAYSALLAFIGASSGDALVPSFTAGMTVGFLVGAVRDGGAQLTPNRFGEANARYVRARLVTTASPRDPLR